MKIQPQETVFKPVVLILETQDDVDKLFALSNHSDTQAAVELGELHTLLHPLHSPDYRKYHEALCRL